MEPLVAVVLSRAASGSPMQANTHAHVRGGNGSVWCSLVLYVNLEPMGSW